MVCINQHFDNTSLFLICSFVPVSQMLTCQPVKLSATNCNIWGEKKATDMNRDELGYNCSATVNTRGQPGRARLHYHGAAPVFRPVLPRCRHSAGWCAPVSRYVQVSRLSPQFYPGFDICPCLSRCNILTKRNFFNVINFR